MIDYYVIGHVDLEPTTGHSTQWPCIVEFTFEETLCPVLFTWGKGYGISGESVSVEEACSDEWSEFFERANCSWFRLLLMNYKVSSSVLPKGLLLSELQSRSEVIKRTR